MMLRNLYIRDFNMNQYLFEDIRIGMCESYSVRITSDMMDSFRAISGDINPLHNDTEFAKEHGFDDRVVYGMLTSSFLSTLAGVYLPGENSLIHEVDVKFKKPVFVGDELIIKGEVSDINVDFNVFTMKVIMTNQNEEKVLRGTMRIGFLKRI